MRRSLARFGVLYVAGCEWALGCICICFVLAIAVGALFSKVPNTSRSTTLAMVAASALAGFALICFCAGGALIRGVGWAWFCSWVIGVVTVAFSGYIIHVAMQPDPYGDSGEAGLLGIAMLLFAIPALILLALPSIRAMFSRSLGASALG
jgi:hypothetical protein